MGLLKLQFINLQGPDLPPSSTVVGDFMLRTLFSTEIYPCLVGGPIKKSLKVADLETEKCGKPLRVKCRGRLAR